MHMKHSRFGGWRLLVMGLIMFGLVLLVRGAPASAKSATVTYHYFAGAGPVCSVSPTACPDVASAPNGDTISLAGSGTLSIHPKSVTGGGTYIHKDASGTVLDRNMDRTATAEFRLLR